MGIDMDMGYGYGKSRENDFVRLGFKEGSWGQEGGRVKKIQILEIVLRNRLKLKKAKFVWIWGRIGNSEGSYFG